MERTKEEAIEWAMTTTQPEVALAINGWYIVSGETLARLEQRSGKLSQLVQQAERDRILRAVNKGK